MVDGTVSLLNEVVAVDFDLGEELAAFRNAPGQAGILGQPSFEGAAILGREAIQQVVVDHGSFVGGHTGA